MSCKFFVIQSWNEEIYEETAWSARKTLSKAKSDLLQIRVNPAEKQAFMDAADLDGKKLSEWIRDRLRRISRQELEQANRLVAFLLDAGRNLP